MYFSICLQPIEEVFVEDESTNETTRASTDDIFAAEADFDQFDGAHREEDEKHSKVMRRLSPASVQRNEFEYNAKSRCDRQQFSQFVCASLNHLTERNALNAMMEIQGVLTKYRLASLPNNCK